MKSGVGRLIKGITKGIFISLIAASILVGILSKGLIAIPILILFGGILCLFLYGFGELLEHTSTIAKAINKYVDQHCEPKLDTNGKAELRELIDKLKKDI